MNENYFRDKTGLEFGSWGMIGMSKLICIFRGNFSLHAFFSLGWLSCQEFTFLGAKIKEKTKKEEEVKNLGKCWKIIEFYNY